MAEKWSKPKSLQKALLEAIAHHDRGIMISELVACMVHQVPYIAWQHKFSHPTGRYNFLRRIENPLSRPAIPRSLSDLPFSSSKVEE